MKAVLAQKYDPEDVIPRGRVPILRENFQEASDGRATRLPRAPADGGLRALLRRRLPDWQWSAVESGLASPGIPDAEYCAPGGASGWVECKATRAWAVRLRPLQVAWIDRRARMGGRVWLAVRRQNRTRRGETDRLYLVPGVLVKRVEAEGLREAGYWSAVEIFGGGPEGWDWVKIGRVMSR